MPDSANNSLGLPYPISNITSQTYTITLVVQIKTLDFWTIAHYAEVQRASHQETGMQIIPSIPNPRVMHKETESDEYFDHTENRNTLPASKGIISNCKANGVCAKPRLMVFIPSQHLPWA